MTSSSNSLKIRMKLTSQKLTSYPLKMKMSKRIMLFLAWRQFQQQIRTMKLKCSIYLKMKTHQL